MDNNRVKALRAIFSLAQSPEEGHLLTGDLRGARSLDFTLPGGAYRAAYVMEAGEELCLVFLVGPRENFYKKATRRYVALKKLGELDT